MTKKRDVWDLLNRQKRVWQKAGAGQGPSPIGDALARLLARHYSRLSVETAQRHGDLRHFAVTPALREWLAAPMSAATGSPRSIWSRVQSSIAPRSRPVRDRIRARNLSVGSPEMPVNNHDLVVCDGPRLQLQWSKGR